MGKSSEASTLPFLEIATNSVCLLKRDKEVGVHNHVLALQKLYNIG